MMQVETAAFTYRPAEVTTGADGSTDISFEGGRVHVGPDGTIQPETAERIQSIGVENALDLKHHAIMRDGNVRIHRMEFWGGGIADIRFTDDGHLQSFEAKHLRIAVRDGVHWLLADASSTGDEPRF